MNFNLEKLIEDKEELGTVLIFLALLALATDTLIWFAILAVVIVAILGVWFLTPYTLDDVFSFFKRTTPPPVVTRPKFAMKLGKNIANGSIPILPLAHMGHIFISGQTRFGKTVLLYHMTNDLLTNNDPEELQLAFCDPKLSTFKAYLAAPHVFLPIAVTKEETEILLDIAIKEMERRKRLFDGVGRVCANIDRYEYLTGERLPRIVIIFDELADAVDKGSTAEAKMTTLAKQSLAAGIHMILTTQRPTREAISHEIQSQCSTFMVTYMRRSNEYAIAGVPDSIYRSMEPKKGLFMVYSPELAKPLLDSFPSYEGWGYLQTPYVSEDDVEAVTRRFSADPSRLTWGERRHFEEEEDSVILPLWEGTAEDKIDAIHILSDYLEREPAIQDVVDYYHVSRPTAGMWLKRAYPDD